MSADEEQAELAASAGTDTVTVAFTDGRVERVFRVRGVRLLGDDTYNIAHDTDSNLLVPMRQVRHLSVQSAADLEARRWSAAPVLAPVLAPLPEVVNRGEPR